jgi:hypothetical protein
MTEPELLFHGGDLRLALEATREKMLAEVAAAAEDYLLNVDIDEWVAHLEGSYRVECPRLREGEMEVEDLGETQVDVSHQGFIRGIDDPDVPAYVGGRSVLLHIPFDGEAELFSQQPSTYTFNPPRAIVAAGELQRPISYPTDTARPDIKGIADDLVRKVDQYLGWARPECEGHNSGLADAARRAITDRRERVLADHDHLQGIGIPVRRRGDAPRTYQAEAVRRKPAPRRPGAPSGAPKAAEPVMVDELHAHTLGVARSWVRAMERTPGDYTGAKEEALRDALLVMLNTHFEGDGQAEAFNKSGKTDILIRVGDRNIFIAECKRWSGEKGLGEALDQLLSYATWRDGKLALIFFVDRRDITAVVTKAREALAAHGAFDAWLEAEGEGELHCTLRPPEDEGRTAELTVLFVHLPKPTGDAA